MALDESGRHRRPRLRLAVVGMVANVAARFASYFSPQLDKSGEPAGAAPRVQISFLLFLFIFLFFFLPPHHCLEVFVSLQYPLCSSRSFSISLNSFKADFGCSKTD